MEERTSVTEQIQYRVYSDFDQEDDEDSTHWEVAARATVPRGPWHWEQCGPSYHLLKDHADRVIFAFDPASAPDDRLRLLPAAERAIAAAPTTLRLLSTLTQLLRVSSGADFYDEAHSRLLPAIDALLAEVTRVRPERIRAARKRLDARMAEGHDEEYARFFAQRRTEEERGRE
jgi:hypothetical protein